MEVRAFPMPNKQQQKEVVNTFSDKLIVHLVKALEINPEFSEAHCQLALIYQENGDYTSAEEHFQKAIKLDNKLIIEIEKRSVDLLQKFQFQNAKFQFRKAKEKRYQSARVHFQLSSLYEIQQQLSRAKTCLEKSIELNSLFPEAFRNLGIILSQLKSYAAARLHIEKALDLNYGDCISHLNLGIIMIQGKEYVDAERHLLIALDINPKFVVCILEMSHLQLLMKNKIEAKKYYQMAQEISPDIK